MGQRAGHHHLRRFEPVASYEQTMFMLERATATGQKAFIAGVGDGDGLHDLETDIDRII